MKTLEIRDVANRLIRWSYDYEEADKGEITDMEMAKEGLLKELRDLLNELEYVRTE